MGPAFTLQHLPPVSCVRPSWQQSLSQLWLPSRNSLGSKLFKFKECSGMERLSELVIMCFVLWDWMSWGVKPGADCGGLCCATTNKLMDMALLPDESISSVVCAQYTVCKNYAALLSVFVGSSGCWVYIVYTSLCCLVMLYSASGRLFNFYSLIMLGASAAVSTALLFIVSHFGLIVWVLSCFLFNSSEATLRECGFIFKLIASCMNRLQMSIQGMTRN